MAYSGVFLGPVVPPSCLNCFIDTTLTDIYGFLGLDPTFKPELASKRVHSSWGWNRIVFNYYMGKVFKGIGKTRLAGALDRFNIFEKNVIKAEDIEYLRSVYLPERDELENIIGRKLPCWDYGKGVLEKHA